MQPLDKTILREKKELMGRMSTKKQAPSPNKFSPIKLVHGNYSYEDEDGEFYVDEDEDLSGNYAFDTDIMAEIFPRENRLKLVTA